MHEINTFIYKKYCKTKWASHFKINILFKYFYIECYKIETF